MYYVVTGACGFIGANLVKALNERGVTDIIAVDNLKSADKFLNLTDCEIADYLDKQEFLDLVEHGQLDGGVEAILHQGACSDTMETDGRYMMANNFRYSQTLLDFCMEQEIPLLYASSASVYGGGGMFREERGYEAPLNVYGYSKFLFDQVVRRRIGSDAASADSQVAGFRYFNVYGPREQHKGRMASVAFHHFNQYRADGKVRLFEGHAGYGNGEERRDFHPGAQQALSVREVLREGHARGARRFLVLARQRLAIEGHEREAVGESACRARRSRYLGDAHRLAPTRHVTVARPAPP